MKKLMIYLIALIMLSPVTAFGGDDRRQKRKVEKALRDNEMDYERRKQQEEWDRLKRQTDRDRKRIMNPKNDLDPMPRN